MWLPLLLRLGGDARRCRWYGHGQCTRYVAGESHAANSYLCAQKSRAATTLSVLNVVPSCLGEVRVDVAGHTLRVGGTRTRPSGCSLGQNGLV